MLARCNPDIPQSERCAGVTVCSELAKAPVSFDLDTRLRDYSRYKIIGMYTIALYARHLESVSAS